MDRLVVELREIRKLIGKSIGILLALFVFLLTAAPTTQEIGGTLVPWITFHSSSSFATLLFLSAKESLIPPGVSVIALGPVSSFLAPLMMAFLVAFLATFPFLVFFLARFLYPALHPAERRIVSRTLIPSLFLFYLGCSLAYFLIIPQTFAILYSFADPMGVAPLFALDDFIVSVFVLTVSVGLSFLLPVVMVVLARIKVVSGTFWIRHARGALLATLIFSAVVTPDGSGVTMLFLSLPLMGLYGIGALIAQRNNSMIVV